MSPVSRAKRPIGSRSRRPWVDREPSPYPRVKARTSSGVVQLAGDRAQDEPRGLGRLAAELLALVLLQRQRRGRRASRRASASAAGPRRRTRPRGRPRRAARSRPRDPSPPCAPGTPPAPRRRRGRCWARRLPAGVLDRDALAGRGAGRGCRRCGGRAGSGGTRPSATARSCQRELRHSGSSTLMCSSSHQRPSRQIASRARPSVTKPTRRYARIARSLNANTDSATRCSPSDPKAWSTIRRVASLP